MSRVIFDGKLQDESKNYIFDFTSMLAAGETLSTAQVAATVYSGTDSSPSQIVSGSATISGAKVTQLIVAGVEGVVYDVACYVTTSLGQTLVLNGYIAVLPQSA